MNKEIKKYGKLECLVYYPEKLKEKNPLLIFLHGSGQRGKNPEALKDHGPMCEAERGKEFPFIIIAPQCPFGDTWLDISETLYEVLFAVSDISLTDKERVYLTGFSMGAYAVWNTAMRYPELFSAIIPVCGGGQYWNAEKLINLPCLALHGADDQVVLPRESERMVEIIRYFGGKPEIVIYPNEHHGVAKKIYSDNSIYDWLLKHKKEKATREV